MEHPYIEWSSGEEGDIIAYYELQQGRGEYISYFFIPPYNLHYLQKNVIARHVQT